MFQLVSLNIFKFHSTWAHSQLRCFKSLSNKFFFFQMTILAHLMHITDLPHCIPSSSNSWSNGWSFDTFKWTPFNWTLDSGSISNHSQLTSFFLERLIFPHTYLTPPFFSINTLTSWIDFMPPYSPLVLYLYFHHYPSKPWIYLFPSFVCHKQSDNKFSF